MTFEQLVPITLIVPLAVAGAMLAVAHFLPRYVPDVIAIAAALFVAGAGATLAVHTLQSGPIDYWFGGWRPWPNVVVGIGLGVDAASAALAGFIGLLFAATLVFAWGYYDEVHAHFHVLMLLFMAAMTGFCLTRDLFDLFVWFEVMSVVAFALTAYQLEAPSLAGALNFTVSNTLASMMMLGGVGLIYARTGVLDFGRLGQILSGIPHDPVLTGAFCLLAAALLIKGAAVPFHFWLSDAHAVAPSPVSVIFSGAMVSVALFALAKIGWQVFGAFDDVGFLFRHLILALGCLTAVVGGVMAWLQRHLKRMLAFSTIAHLGIMLIGVACLSGVGAAGLITYVVGHGLVKATLFMLVGVLLAREASVDELDLRGRGGRQWPAGVLMGLAGLLLGGAPLGVLDAGLQLVHDAGRHSGGVWAIAAILVGTALTGATVLRATGRIYLNLGGHPGAEADGPTQQEGEKADRPLWLMLLPCVILLGLALAPATAVHALSARLAGELVRSPAPVRLPPPSHALAWAATGLSLLLAAAALFRERLPGPVTTGAGLAVKPLFHLLRRLHSGLIGDYVAWIVAGLAFFSAAAMLQ